MEKNYMTVSELFTQAAKLAKSDPAFVKAEENCPLDYDQICSGLQSDQLRICQFDVIGYADFGGSEGIYGDVFLYGEWMPQQLEAPKHSKMRVYVLKTLHEDKEAFLAMSVMAHLICYYARRIVNQNLERFD